MLQDLEHAGGGPAAGSAGEPPEDSHQPGSCALGRACSNIRSATHLWLFGRPCEGALSGLLGYYSVASSASAFVACAVVIPDILPLIFLDMSAA